MDRVSGKLTIYFEDPFWVGVFERIENRKLSVAKVTFGAEPKDYEVLEFINRNYYHLQFSLAVETVVKDMRWLSYDSLNIELPDGYLFFPPIVNWGRYRAENGRLMMPLSVRLNHAIADGFLVANVYRLLEKEMAVFSIKRWGQMKIEHIAMYVNDLEGTRDFFVKYLGGLSNDGYHNELTGFRSYFITFDDGARLEIMNKPSMEDSAKRVNRTGYIHIAFSVGSAEEVDRLTRVFREDGYEVINGPRTTGDGYYESCIIGVEGNQIEITA